MELSDASAPAPTPDIYWKDNPGRPGAWEVAGLRWLADAPSGVPVVTVHEHNERGLGIDRVSSMTPTCAMAEDFGRKLALTHAAGALHFGFSPTGESGFQGPNDNLLELPLKPYENWGEFYANVCLAPLIERVFDNAPAEVTQLLESLRAGQLDDGTPPARIHGDLWAGNVLWGKVASTNRTGGILIDPSAHGGHPRADLAALRLFGAPHLSCIEGAYFDVASEQGVLGADEPGWGTDSRSVDLHQQHLLWLHAAVFGGGYVGEATAAAARVIRTL